MTEDESKSWLGTSLTDIYKGQGPWCFATTPISPSKYHHVLFQVPVTLDKPPEPHYNAFPKHWDDDHVRMPYSEQSLFVVKDENEEEVIKPRWDVICDALSKPIDSVEAFEAVINSYNTKLPKFSSLQHFFNESLEEEESEYFFKNVLPGIIQLALRLPEFLPGSLPLLKKNASKSISLSQLQVASLLANAFLCTFIWRQAEAGVYPPINFVRLFAADVNNKKHVCVMEKFKCLIHYFRSVITKHPVGVITFERKCIAKNQVPRWDTLDNNLGNTRIHIDSAGTIEEAQGLLQVDFANKRIGGGILGHGCVQEEIRFVICPELIISRLFTEELENNEAVIITGVQTYSKYSGYAQTFQWEGAVDDPTPFDDHGRRRTTILVIDATRFNRPKDQYHGSAILRELNKAYVGFSSREKSNLAPIATGNWGCGAFKGDVNLKCLIQLMACSAANRDLVYFSFGNTEIRDQFYNMHLFLATNAITITQMWRYLCRFCAANLPADQLYSFIQQCHFDLKSQPTLTQFFNINAKKNKADGVAPSTSSSKNENKLKNTPTIHKKDKIQSTHSASTSKGWVIPKFNKDVRVSADEKKVSASKLLMESNNRDDDNKVCMSKRPNRNKDSVEGNKLVDSDAIIDLTAMIDGSMATEKQCDVEEPCTLLGEVDKMKKVPMKQSNEICDDINKEEDMAGDNVEIAMEVDDEEVASSSSFIGDKKKKITDYFSKITTHVNNYL